MIRWEPGLAGDTPGPEEALNESLLGRLRRLGETLAQLDATDPDIDSTGFDRATDRLIAAARDAMTAAEPIIEQPQTLVAVFCEATSALRDLTGWCRACEQSDSDEVCGDHAADLTRADTYDALLTAITGPTTSGH
jgi:hypothetical protein